MLSSRRPGRRGRANERGAAVVSSMLVLMIITLLGIGLLARSQSGLRTTAAMSASERAVLAAEVGVAEAMARLANGEQGDFRGSGPLPDGTFQYEAVLAQGRYQVTAAATIEGRTRTVAAIVAGTPSYPDALFVGIKGQLAQGVGVSGSIGTNGRLVIDRGARLEGQQTLYGDGASCQGCPNPVLVGDPRVLSVPVEPDPRAVQRCPSDGTFTGIIDGKKGQPFSCEGPVVALADQVIVTNGPVIIQVADGTAIKASSAIVNAGGSPADFQIIVSGDRGELYFEDTAYRGLFYAPARHASLAQTRFAGSLTVGQLDTKPDTGVSIAAASNEDFGLREWRIIEWRDRGGS